MKKPLLFLTALLFISTISFSQNRFITRGAEPGELYLAQFWYGIYSPIWGPPFYDTLRVAAYRLTENGKKLTIQYDVDYFAHDYNPPESVMVPNAILADATPGVLYMQNVYSKNSYAHTSLWISFDYGENWIFREENIGSKTYRPANFGGLLFRGGTDGTFKSEDFGNTFTQFNGGPGMEPGLQYGEGWRLWVTNLYQGRIFHSCDFFETSIEVLIDSQFVFGQVGGVVPDVFRGGLPGEVYVTSWFPGYTYKVSFSADTGRTFRHVYITDYDPYNPFIDKPYFMSDREPGVFYIIRMYEVEELNPWGSHIKICIEHYKDYGETLVNVYCHDLTKDYEYEEAVCEPTPTHLASSVHFNTVQLQWSNPANSGIKAGYHIFRNHTRITNSLFTNTTYLDENLPDGDYEYQVVTYYSNGCLPDTSNYVIETVLTCEAVNDLASEKSTENSVLLTWSEPEEEVEVAGYHVYRNDLLLTVTLNTSYLDENLPAGDYEYYVVVHYTNGCLSAASNKVEETVEVGINEIAGLAGIMVYPNPTTGELWIFLNFELEILNFELFDIYGKKINSKFKTQNSKFVTDISHLQAGVYFVRIITEQGIAMRKVVKQ